MRRGARFAWLAGAAAGTIALPASAAVIQVSPADGNTAYTKIEAAGPGDEVVIAPGTYAFRVYLQAQAPASQPIYIHAADPANPPVWNLAGTLVENAPGSYTAPDKNRGCWQVSGGTNYHIDGIVFENCHAADNDSAGLRYYSGTTGLLITNCLFQNNDNGLTGGTGGSDATVEFSEFSQNGNLSASTSSPTHNVYIYGGTFALRYSYLHDPLQAENLHCRAVTSTIEYNWFDRAKIYEGDLMTSDDYANSPVGSLVQTMMLRGNVIIETAAQSNQSQIWAIYNDEASGSPVSFSITALYNTVVSDGGHGAFLHVSNADGTQMTAVAEDNIVSGTSQPILVEDLTHATVTGKNNWLQTGASLTGLSGVTGSIFGSSPGFANAAAYDFSLAAGSACLGAADTSVGSLPVAEYYENETVTRMYRARATAMDLGAFEHTTAGPGVGPYGPDGGGVASAPDAGVTVPPDAGVEDATVAEAGTPPVIDGGARGSGTGDAGEAIEGPDAAVGHTGSSGGCGCRIPSGGAGDGLAAAGLAGLAAAMVARRRRRGSPAMGGPSTAAYRPSTGLAGQPAHRSQFLGDERQLIDDPPSQVGR